MLLIKPLLALRPSKLDWIFAIKTFMAGMLALYVAFSLNLAYPIWAIGTVFVIANPFSGMSASKGFFRALGTLLGALVSLAVTPILINTPLIFTLFLACWVGFCLYVSLLDRTPRSYVFMLAGYTTVIISYTIIYNIETASLFDMAIGRFLEILVGVVCSAIVSTTIFPMHMGPALSGRVSKALDDTRNLYQHIFNHPTEALSYRQALNAITRDISDLHVMATHLAYEKSELQGMTKPLQEMLHQLSLVTTNLVSMAERLKQLPPEFIAHSEMLQHIHSQTVEFLTQDVDLTDQHLNRLPEHYDENFQQLFDQVEPEHRIILASLKMDIRHFIQNIRAIKLIWIRIQKGDVTLPETVTPLTATYPQLHRDHGVAIRGGVAAFIVVVLSTGFWILSGWKAGFMLAEMAAISACILTSMDNPVPALKMFIRGNIYAGIMVFIYAYGIFPHVTSFWQLAVVLAPFVIFCLLLFPHPPLTGIALPLLMGVIMGLNLQNRYMLDQIFFFDATIGTVLGPIFAVYIVHLVRAMSPDITAQRILTLHYQAIRQALYIPYGVNFKTHLRTMLDRIGVLNTKMVQSDILKKQVNLSLIESSAVVDLTRLEELRIKLEQQPIAIKVQLLQDALDGFFLSKSKHEENIAARDDVLLNMDQLELAVKQLDDPNIAERLMISINNIRNSLCHVTQHDVTLSETGVTHG
jgi:uncharacterized membrane protein YccC